MTKAGRAAPSVRNQYVPRPDVLSAMRTPLGAAIAAFTIATMMITLCPGLASPSQAADSQVPAPNIHERHEFNVYEGYNGTQHNRLDHETWGVGIYHGSVDTLIGACNYTDTDSGRSNVAYSQNINFWTNQKLWIAMFMIDRVIFRIGGQEDVAELKTCSGFTVSHTDVVYDGTVPTMYVNVTFEDIQVYTNESGSSFDMTLIHRFRGDWNETHIKLEALFNFANTRFHANGSELPAGEPFTVELRYVMELTDPDCKTGDNAVAPSGVTDTTLEYNLTLNSGRQYTLSKLDMREGFTIYNATGAHSATAYSTMHMNDTSSGMNMYNPKSAVVTHGFPNLTYMDTQSLHSDPEITVFHDRATVNGLQGPYYLIPVFAAVGVVAAVVVVRKRRKMKGPEKRQEAH